VSGGDVRTTIQVGPGSWPSLKQSRIFLPFVLPHGFRGPLERGPVGGSQLVGERAGPRTPAQDDIDLRGQQQQVREEPEPGEQALDPYGPLGVE
jgi:hypothetical protein